MPNKKKTDAPPKDTPPKEPTPQVPAKKDAYEGRVREAGMTEFIPLKLQSFNEAMKFAEILVATGFLPEAIKTPGQAVAIMLQGQELGLPSMLSLQEIYAVHGKLSTSAKVMLSMFKRAGGKTKVIKDTKEVTEIHFTHPNGDEYTSIFTWKMATDSKLTGGHNYKNWPEDMIWARCVSRGLRRLAPDIIGNLYTPDELGATLDAPSGKVIDVTAEPVPDPEGPVNLDQPMAVRHESESDGDQVEHPEGGDDASKPPTDVTEDPPSPEPKQPPPKKAPAKTPTPTPDGPLFE